MVPMTSPLISRVAAGGCIGGCFQLWYWWCWESLVCRVFVCVVIQSGEFVCPQLEVRKLLGHFLVDRRPQSLFVVFVEIARVSGSLGLGNIGSVHLQNEQIVNQSRMCGKGGRIRTFPSDSLESQ